MAMVMALTTTSGCRQTLGLGRRLLVMAFAFVFCTSLLLEGVHCDTGTFATAPTPPWPDIPIFHQFEVDALNAILTKWSTLSPQLTTLLNWTSDVHPCKVSSPRGTLDTGWYEGAWGGVRCTPVRQQRGNYYMVSVTDLKLYGGNSSCDDDGSQCGFEGITGELPSEIGNLTNLVSLAVTYSPNLTGPVPLEIFQLPRLQSLYLNNNSLSGTLPSDILSTDCRLQQIDVGYNNFSGNLRVSPKGNLFCPTLSELDASHNQLDGPLNFENLNSNASITDLASNRFNGSLSIGLQFSTGRLNVSYNTLTSIDFPRSNDFHNFMTNLETLDIAKNNLSGSFPSEIMQMPSLGFLNLSYNSFDGSIDLRNLTKSSSVYSMDISYNNLNGTFFTGPFFNPKRLDVSNNHLKCITFNVFNKSTTNNGNGYMPRLFELSMQKNNLHGTFPTMILTSPNLDYLNCDQNLYEKLDLPNLPTDNFSLSHFYMTNNCLKDVQFAAMGPLSYDYLLSSEILFVGGNPYCSWIKNVLRPNICRFNQSSSKLWSNVVLKSSIKKKIIIATTTSLSFAFMFLVAATYIWRLMHRIESLRNILKEFEKHEVKPNLYSYKDIKVATNNFDKHNKLGEGGYGVVYKGELNNDTTVAVKKLIRLSHQVLSEFLHEVVILAGLKHRNLVKLKGCCLGDGDQRMLVFEYVENKNLAEALWPHDEGHCESPIINWKTRFNIILGMTRGLAYLHEELQSPIIRRDIKPTNILLDKDYNPKIADFGLAYLYPMLGDEASHLTLTQVAGTRGYCSPEYALHSHISTSIDVYSFGIVALEVVSGRRNIDSQKSNDEIYLREWAWKQYEGQATMTLIDPKMKHSPIDVEAMVRVISVALMCVHYKPTKRPKMHDVVSMLCGKAIIEDFSRGFEYGEIVEDVTSNFYMASGTTSLDGNKLSCIDECSLLSEINILVK